MPGHPSESFGKPLSIAICAAGTDLGATRNRVPSRISPLNGGVVRHVRVQNKTGTYHSQSHLNNKNRKRLRRTPISSDRKTRAAAARRRGVGVLHLEGLAHEVVDEVDLGAF